MYVISKGFLPSVQFNMVNLTSHVLKAADCRYSSLGRAVIPNSKQTVAFRERIPLALRNHVKISGTFKQQKVCVNEMVEMMSCLQKVDQNEAMCQKEIQNFQKCYNGFVNATNVARKAGKPKDIQTGNNVKLSSIQVTDIIRDFPTSKRTRVFYYEKPPNRTY
ncbi:hypothetical protein TCAL_09377 [Tigriopus californicus]|uniref:CHCH domain-containing protein n=2 Tax=Tigriopus californicus TaxID=6832 RepID=A0A553PSR2_TIGCA|nr:hypothetical protein TCAL_09377 [Tigriopus californicus]|eukprot:TCALIF_09377-PA protein Name:"Similar to Chchd1 Coiled-coil-helix-coiled-coil-helix domain-containing protein 1 (Mus musculus)" AED:0.00 eAED:0.00 QI:6/1/1/1/1/1/2/49/162